MQSHHILPPIRTHHRSAGQCGDVQRDRPCFIERYGRRGCDLGSRGLDAPLDDVKLEHGVRPPSDASSSVRESEATRQWTSE